MKRPTPDFLDRAIAEHLDDRVLSILAEAEEFQFWDAERQRELFAIDRGNSDSVLRWLRETMDRGCAKYGMRWSAGLSVLQAISRIDLSDSGAAATEIRRMAACFDAVNDAVWAIVSPDDRYDPLFEKDAMAGEQIASTALFALIATPGQSAEDAVRDAIRDISLDLVDKELP